MIIPHRILARLLALAVFTAPCFCPLVGAVEVKLPTAFPGGSWQSFGRAEITAAENSITVANGWVADVRPMSDCELSFRARMPRSADPLQIWGAIRVKDRENRYAFGLRGGAEPQISLARYASEGNSKFLGFAPLEFKPAPGEWVSVRVAVAGRRFQVFVNNEDLPRINVEDAKGPLWKDGGVGLGGGWLPAEFSDVKVTPLTGARLAAFNTVGDKLMEAPSVDKEARREKQRAAYRPVTVEAVPAGRSEVKLDGNWLFMPDQDLNPDAPAPSAQETQDANWHVIPVPSFWTPTLGWLHGEKGMPDLKGASAYKGPSDKLIVEEYDRVNAQTFDWQLTKAGWYRHIINMPANVSGKQVAISFDAIAKKSEIWVNGIKVGSNLGMFRQIDCDISKAVKPGRNAIAVHVIGNPEKKVAGGNKVEAVAVTVNVTAEMLQSLPHGMADNNSGGIWQPVKLVMTDPVRVSDVFIRPRTDGATAEVEISNGDSRARAVELFYSIRDNNDHTTLDASAKPVVVTVPGGGKTSLKIETPALHPKLWSPREPNLYVLDLKLAEGGKTLDQQGTRFGFRTFTVNGGKFLLNGKPYWLRGGNHTPSTLRPNDGSLARRFMKLAREGNIWVTRSHSLPFTETWFDAADEIGFGVSMEGTWPWLMLKGEPPKPELIALWKEEFSGLLRKHRNHPSLLFWTVNNEMNFAHFDEKDNALLKRKWIVLDDMIRSMRGIDPTRPISAYSGYVRRLADKGFQAVVKPDRFDDGDIDDAHVYYNWYNESSFHLFDGEFGKKMATPGRPLISQEISTGYPRNDDWPSRSYQFYRYVPQALVGNYSYEQNDPAIFMTRQAFMTKEVMEVIRRTNRDESAGLLPFAYLTWFTDVWKSESIRPKLTYYEVKKAMQGVLVSAELFGRHFYTGDVLKRRVCIVNDADNQSSVPAGTLVWEFRDGATVFSKGQIATPTVGYYTNQWVDAELQTPALSKPRIDAKLVLTLTANGRTVSTNDYDVVLASREWAAPKTAGKVPVFDPHGKCQPTLAGIKTIPVNSITGNSLVIGDLGALLQSPGGGAKLNAFVQAGGKVLLLQPGNDLVKFLPELVTGYRKVDGEIVTMQVPESRVFDGIQPLDTAWFEMGDRNLPYACQGVFEVNGARTQVATLALQCNFHPDVKRSGFTGIAGYPLVEIRLGKGLIIASEMMLSAKDKDPIAGRLLRNLLETISDGR